MCFRQQNLLIFKKETNKILYLKHNYLWCLHLDALESTSEIPEKF